MEENDELIQPKISKSSIYCENIQVKDNLEEYISKDVNNYY
jgi:hypothetical protein